MSQPYYTTEALTDADVTGQTSTTVGGQAYTAGMDKTGQFVVKSGSSWYFLNTPAYATAWDTTTYKDAPMRSTVLKRKAPSIRRSSFTTMPMALP